MIKRFIVIVAVFFTVVATAQENVSSPYSYYGIGLNTFKGTVENRSMGGLSMFSDSIHLNLRNPAGYGRLRRTTYAVGGSHERLSLNSDAGEDNAKVSSLDYLAIGVPIGGNLGFGIGVCQSCRFSSGNKTPGRHGAWCRPTKLTRTPL